MNNKNVYMYFHAGSKNHGCEAIVRSTCKLLKSKPYLISDEAEDDRLYHIDQIACLKGKPALSMSYREKVFCAFTSRILKSERYGYKLHAKSEATLFGPNSIAFSIGGDNYCYGEAYNLHLASLNKELHRHQIKTVLWGCSIEPKMVTKAMKKDFALYNLIVARETISYQFLKKYNHNTILACDPAFLLERGDVILPHEFVPGKTIGINLSPLIQKSECIKGITLENYNQLIQHILKDTHYNIALIPHVVSEGNDDREAMRPLYEKYKESKRVCFIEDDTCIILKGVISNCKMFVGARTHATIAAYSTGVPTLVIGYSTKATGIARDLFGTEDNYVLPVQNLKQPDDLVKAFDWLDNNFSEISIQLKTKLPSYTQTIKNAVSVLEQL